MNRFLFVPATIETLGVYGAAAVTYIQALGERLKLVTGDARFAFFLKQGISRAVQRGKASAIFGSLQAGKRIFNCLALNSI